MKKTTVRCHLMDILAEVTREKRETSLRAILALGIVATLSGAKSYAAIAEYGRSHDQLRESWIYTLENALCCNVL